MSDVFRVHVNESFQLQINKQDALNLNTSQNLDGSHHILLNHQSYRAEIIDSDFNKKIYKVKINNNEYKVNIFNDLDILIESMGFTSKSTKSVHSILAPMPGLILEINVQVGQTIKENESLLILEAMKMENIIASPRDGTIKSLAVGKGDAVLKNQLLIEFE